MRFISTRTHAINDYIFGVMLIVVPLFFWDEGGPAVLIPIIIGIVLTLQSLVTNYEFSIAKLVPVNAHLAMDAMAGLLLAASPWLFGFAERVWIPHVVVGALEVILALTTHVNPGVPANYPNPPSRAASTSS